MIPESGEMGHGKDYAISIGDIYEAVLHRGTMSGISGQLVVEIGVCMLEMRLPSRIPAGQRTVSMCQMPPSGFSNSGNGAS